MLTFEAPFAIALNHVLEGEAWARERLAAFAGETVELCAPPLPTLRFAIADGGRVAPAGSLREASLVVTIGAGALAAAAQGEEQFMRAVQLAGNAKLANELLDLARHLRWDVEEDLAGLFGDIAAHRLVGLGRRMIAWHGEAAKRLGTGALEHAVGDGQLLVTRSEFETHAALAARLRDAIERLEARLRHPA